MWLFPCVDRLHRESEMKSALGSTQGDHNMQLRKKMVDHWRQFLYTGCFALAVCCPAIAFATPQNGFGAYLGIIGASENSVTSNGTSVGVDAQFAINDNWSLNPYLMTSLEHSSVSTTVSDELVGMQVRRWFGDWFVGGQVFVHDRLIVANGTTQNSSYGAAPGVLAGVEYSNGWGVEIQADTFENSSLTPGVFRNAVRLHLTYRWY